MILNIQEDWKAAEAAVATLKEIEKSTDIESAHWDADQALLSFLKDIGHRDVAEAWERALEKVGFWYA